MNYLHWEFDAGPQNVIEVTLDRQANVRLLDSSNYQQYREGHSHRYLGGLAERSPIRLTPLSLGRWHVVVDLGGHVGSVRASTRLLAHR